MTRGKGEGSVSDYFLMLHLGKRYMHFDDAAALSDARVIYQAADDGERDHLRRGFAEGTRDRYGDSLDIVSMLSEVAA